MNLSSFPLAILAAATLFAQAPQLPPDPPAIDPALPFVLIIGDSISIGYTTPLRKLLQGEANVYHNPENGGPTINGLEKLESWLVDRKWDVIHFNFGLHDLKIMEGGGHQVEPPQYEENLRKIVSRLKTTGAKLIWATTTPVPEGTTNPKRRVQDPLVYNEMALRVMKENDITVDDLYAFALPRLAEIQQPANVHYTEKGSEALAGEVAASVRAALRARAK